MQNTHTTLTSLFSDIADAIRAKTGGTDDIVADSFPTAISAIPTGRQPILQELTVTENITYTPPHGTDGFNRVVVNQTDAVPGNIVTGKTILGVAGTARKITKITGTYTPSTDTYNISIPYGNLFALVFHTNSASDLYPAAENGDNPVYRLFGVIPEDSSSKTAFFGCQYLDEGKSVKPDTGYMWSKESETRLYVGESYGNIGKKFISGKTYSYIAYRLEVAK